MSITLTAGVTAGDSALPVSAAPSFQNRPFLAQIEAEQVNVLAAGTQEWLVQRGQNGTSPVAHAQSAVVTPLFVSAQPTAVAGPPGRIDFSSFTPGTETAGSLITTGTTWVPFTTAGACGMKLLLENDSATGEFATLRMRARANKATASGDGGNSIGTTTAGDFSASAQHADYGVLKAINAVAQPNALAQTTDATNIVTALYGRIDATAASVGRRWVGWFDTHATTRADGSDHLVRLSHNGTAAIDGVFTIYNGGRMAALFTFEDIAGFLSASSSGSLTKTHKIAVEIAGVGTRYIEVGTIA
jgi:hypothetical protein